ncbi:MAG: hypothetical protein MRECE_1c133 [Mycoplasmataceae bacterium CE_OT135]|nr:MAG: hypothetical protein MRECE_1c036 [Mycoplasmataceae bacterium CE_OT135]KLL04358.1 MAG: hypothetical protein MRECE_1c133 [Mycoplasmataceae bacterium CE_OT135]
MTRYSPRFNYQIRKKWEENFVRKEVEKLIEVGFKINNLDEAKSWKDRNFDVQQIQEWITSGAKIDDYEFISWLRNVKKFDSEWINNYKEHYHSLKEKFEKYGLCQECQQFNTGENWCQLCNIKHLKKEFENWTSGNSEIDEFIQKYQLAATDKNKFLEWIPYEQFTDIEFLAEGGFGKVYKAKWTQGRTSSWNVEENKWQRNNDDQIVALKSLNSSSQNVTSDLLKEIANHKVIDDWFNSIVPCYGLSQDPITKNYLMVMQYLPEGNLRNYLKNNRLNLKNKLERLSNIAKGLRDIHQRNLVHRDFHVGNILNKDIYSFITDLGLCRPANEVNDGNVYGVIPYVAPEILLKKPYTQASDVYSFGIIAYEVLSDLPPYAVYDQELKIYKEVPHDTDLVLKVCQGLRPNLNAIEAPQLLKDLIERCWDADREKRPSASEIEKNLDSWIHDFYKRSSKFYQQYQTTTEAEEERFCQALSLLYRHYKNQDKKVKPEELEKVAQELFTEFRKNHNYEEETEKVKEEFGKLLYSLANGSVCRAHPQAIYTSRLLDFKNLPEPRNSKEINDEIWSVHGSKDAQLDISELNLDELVLQGEQENFRQTAQILQTQLPKNPQNS